MTLARLAPVNEDVSVEARRVPRSNRVAAAELEGQADQTLEQALLRVRPEFFRLNPAGTPRAGGRQRPSIYIDNAYAGDIDMLRFVPVAAVDNVLYLPPSAAHDRFGAYCPCEVGVVLVMTRRER
jgi:hypothetical protein